MDKGFIKLMRTNELIELLHNEHNCFILITFIAYRAKRKDEFSIYGLEQGQAMIGDYKHMGLSEQQYRTAKRKLEKWGFITCEATSRGTIATIKNTRVYDINLITTNEQDNTQATDEQRTANGQLTTNNNERKKERKKERIKTISVKFANSKFTFDNCDDLFLKWKEAYPAVDIKQEIRKAELWILANPKKIRKDYVRFLNNWFCRVQEKGGYEKSNRPNYEPKKIDWANS